MSNFQCATPWSSILVGRRYRSLSCCSFAWRWHRRCAGSYADPMAMEPDFPLRLWSLSVFWASLDKSDIRIGMVGSCYFGHYMETNSGLPWRACIWDIGCSDCQPATSDQASTAATLFVEKHPTLLCETMAKGDLAPPGSLCRSLMNPHGRFQEYLGMFKVCFIREDKMLKLSGTWTIVPEIPSYRKPIEL